MEPFGLFDLLNSMLNGSQKNAQSEEEKKPSNADDTSEEKAEIQRDNAYVQFFEAHERRANRRQK